MLDRVLNMSEHGLSFFGMVLRGIHRKVDICQTDYVSSKLEFFPYSEVIINGGSTFKLTKVNKT